MIHTVNDDVDFRALVLDVEYILADAIVTCICRIGLQCDVFRVLPSDRKLERFSALTWGVLHGFFSKYGSATPPERIPGFGGDMCAGTHCDDISCQVALRAPSRRAEIKSGSTCQG